MSTSKNFGLSQLALHNVKLQSGLGQVCNLYKSRVASAVASTSVASKNSNHNGGRISKLIGVKKTLVNQMQGMTQNARPKMKSRALTLGTSSKYSIYGQTKLFSSMSSLHGRSSSSSGISPSLNHRRCLSNLNPRENPVRYIVHQRYHQSGKLQEKRNEDIARDISQSIKSELMDVDSSTKRLISCSRSRYANANSNAAAEQEDGEEGEQPMQKQKFTCDPLEGWNHPRAVKNVDAMKFTEDDRDRDLDLARQCKPLRRKSRNIRYKDESNVSVSVNQQFVQPSLQSRKMQLGQLGELYVKTAVERTNYKHKSGHYRQQQQEQEKQPDEDDDELMSVPQSNANDLEAGDARLKDSATERDFIDRNMSSSKRDDSDMARMDEQHYQSKMAANLMSASQRVINKQFEGYRKEMSDSRNKLKQIKLAKTMVKTVNPIPPLKSTSRAPGVPKSRLKAMVRSKDSIMSSQGKVKAKSMAKSAAQLWKRKRSDAASMLDRYGEHYMDKLMEKPREEQKRTAPRI